MSTDFASEPTAGSRRVLPTYYYHEHFLEMLAFVERHYAHALQPCHVAYLERFRTLPSDAQRLYVRLANRKGRVFAAGRLRYPELGDLPALISTLRQAGWLVAPRAQHFDEVLRFLTRDEIYRALLPAFAGLSRSLKKAQLVAFARAHVSACDFVGALAEGRLLVQGYYDESRFLLFLYFGRVQDSLSKFTMRDLGLVRVQTSHEDFEPRFGDSLEAAEHYYYAVRLHGLQKADEDCVRALIAEADNWPAANFPGSASARDLLAYKLGRQAEKFAEPDSALRLYRAGESVRCSERQVRLLLAAGNREGARRCLDRMLAEPRSDEEWLLARDLHERKFNSKRTSRVTDKLRAAEVIDIDESQSGSVERAAVEHFKQKGMEAYRVENSLWRTLFGLLFWEELFTGKDATLHSPFERLPASLLDNSFHRRHRRTVERKLALFDQPSAISKKLLHESTRNYLVNNGVFRWRRETLEAIFALLRHARADALRTMLRRFCENFAEARYGYPDLLLVDDDGARFVEIKAEGDQLRQNQLLRLQQLSGAGFRADVVRVRWVLDPLQEYVVVDVETTGGTGDRHRVTEIGAVKLRNGRIIGRFQTLLNPQRPIPQQITRLTGISNAMVADAPYFADIADEFARFFGDAIFVAHNVDFDYRFISGEFARIGQVFRHPKLCTCASMRRLFSGYGSYSLAALCRQFNIPLDQHHRALCDAEAAAGLLLLVNERRAERLAA